MSLDTETLKTILATSTPSPWEWFAADGDIMLVPNDCKKLPIMSVVARKGSNEYYLDFHNPLTDKMDDGRDVCGQNSNAKLIALAPALAAEVIRLRKELEESQAMTRNVASDLEDAEHEAEEIRADVTRHWKEAERLRERLATVEGERDKARRELAELEAKTNHLHAVLEAPENADKTLTELYVELWGKP
jgi:DNA repair ATPase RecN